MSVYVKNLVVLAERSDGTVLELSTDNSLASMELTMDYANDDVPFGWLRRSILVGFRARFTPPLEEASGVYYTIRQRFCDEATEEIINSLTTELAKEKARNMKLKRAIDALTDLKDTE